jgi:hypothetical protein
MVETEYKRSMRSDLLALVNEILSLEERHFKGKLELNFDGRSLATVKIIETREMKKHLTKPN